MLNHDNYIEGTHDKNAPFNQPDSNETDLCITELFDEKRYKEALDEILFVRNELCKLRDTAKLVQNSYLKNKLNSIIQKI